MGCVDRRNVVLALGGFLVLASCGKEPPPPPPPPVVDLSIEPAADLNPDGEGTPSPAVVRLYQLASGEKFQAADYFQLFEKEGATLGPDLLAREELIVSPGKPQRLTLPMKHDATMLGVIVSFRDIDRADWRAVADVAPSGTTALVAKISSVRLTLAKKGS